MSGKWTKLSGFLVLVLLVCISALPIIAGEKQPEKDAVPEEACMPTFFAKSLHFTGEGMRYWYEEQGGFMEITGIPYDDLGCKSCHVKSCDQCHAEQTPEGMAFSVEKARKMDTCMPCHSREGLTFKFDKEKDMLDVHIAAAMACADCHSASDVHGDGTFRQSMRAEGAVEAECEGCHIEKQPMEAQYDSAMRSHTVHGDKLDCAACHVSNTTACMNCHFNAMLETGKKEGNFIPVKEWTLLINYDDKVTSASAMTLVYNDKPFLGYMPYYTHSVSGNARTCDECHANEAVEKLKAGETIQMFDYENGKAVNFQGVVPLVEGSLDQLKWRYLNKTDDGWEPIPGDPEPLVQIGVYGKLLTTSQFQKLTMPIKE